MRRASCTGRRSWRTRSATSAFGDPGHGVRGPQRPHGHGDPQQRDPRSGVVREQRRADRARAHDAESLRGIARANVVRARDARRSRARWRSRSGSSGSTASSPTSSRNGRERSGSGWRSARSAARFERCSCGRVLRSARVGLAIGLVAALALTRLMSSLLFGIEPTDVVTLRRGDRRHSRGRGARELPAGAARVGDRSRGDAEGGVAEDLRIERILAATPLSRAATAPAPHTLSRRRDSRARCCRRGSRRSRATTRARCPCHAAWS